MKEFLFRQKIILFINKSNDGFKILVPQACLYNLAIIARISF